MVIAAAVAEPAFADETPISARIGLSAGFESSSTVQFADDPDRRTGALMIGLDADTFFERFLLGAGVAAAGAPLSHGALRGSVHAGLQAPTESVDAIALVGIGIQRLDHICDSCSSVAMPYAELRAQVGYPGEHVEVAFWSAVLVDLGRKHLTGISEYDIGGVTFSGGLTIAYVSR